MLAAMTHNGGLLIAIFVSYFRLSRLCINKIVKVGALVGFFLFGVREIHESCIAQYLIRFLKKRDTVPGSMVTESSDYGIHLEQLGFNKEGSKA